MPDISFYILASVSVQQRHLFVCKLIEKIYRSGIFAYVLTDTVVQSQQLDNLLWTFRAGSFIPHQLYTGKTPALQEMVLIGSHSVPEAWQNTVINLSSQVPENFPQVVRLLEVLDNDESTKAFGRQRYRQYQQAGIVPTTHIMGRSGK